MKNWCKIIETETHDVLVQRLSTDEDKEHIQVSMKFDGVLASFKLGYEDDEALADETFQKFSKEQKN